MNTRDKIILYLDNQMSDEEKTRFEKELKNSPSLMKELDDVKDSLAGIKNSLSAGLDGDYFTGVIPEFRRKNENPGKALFPLRKIMTFVPAAAAVIILLFVFLVDKKDENLFDLTSVKNNELKEIISEYSLYENINALSEEAGEQISEKIDSVFADEIFENAGGSEYLESSDYAYILASLSENEIEMIYDQLINKEIITGEL